MGETIKELYTEQSKCTTVLAYSVYIKINNSSMRILPLNCDPDTLTKIKNPLIVRTEVFNNMRFPANIQMSLEDFNFLGGLLCYVVIVAGQFSVACLPLE